MLPEDNRDALSLISDGMQTEGDLSKIVSDLKARGITVDVLPIQFSIGDEVWLERLDFRSSSDGRKLRKRRIVLSSLAAGEGTLIIEENGQKDREESVKFSRARTATRSRCSSARQVTMNTRRASGPPRERQHR